MSSAAPRPTLTLSADEARRIALRAQGLLGAPDRRGGVRGVLRHLGAVQLDTISVLARSHELIPYARLGAVGRPAVEAAYWGAGTTFEYWSHAACILPIEEWPLFSFRRRAFLARGHRWHRLQDAERSCAEVLDRLRTDGPLTATELGGAKAGGEWWDWSETKIAVEWLLDTGQVVCGERRSWKRVYDLAERAVPAALLDADPDDDACLRQLLHQSGVALGVATAKDLSDYHRLKSQQVTAALPDSGLVPVLVEGWGRAGAAATAWADPAALAAEPRGRHRTTLLSPFDSLVWDRARTERIFGLTHRLEAYTPKEKRQHGYFAMPLLTGGQLVGRVDPAREGRTLVARQVSLDSAKHLEALARALTEAASWVGCDGVRVERLHAEALRPALEGLLAAPAVG
ncbi:winged helix-turn-helix domain-containing protein [Streptacidiphilus sp. PB12-B1b]|uniref:winged helix-turn-helix domain-containing protein n=1 Tax=Streptacidiphilus sp. PB12-B1b TaxID=2705012 RepID=UPI0015F9BE48|nr:crosslink repair DNA glycosylase YcaQ family protein [Streptacidiphilus sp. PB12-B1b]QMU75320.1 winged helix-turn-helix domain-containing protein [Streptacidiphilus sp. PB12-B1b]